MFGDSAVTTDQFLGGSVGNELGAVSWVPAAGHLELCKTH